MQVSFGISARCDRLHHVQGAAAPPSLVLTRGLDGSGPVRTEPDLWPGEAAYQVVGIVDRDHYPVVLPASQVEYHGRLAAMADRQGEFAPAPDGPDENHARQAP
jgi:hypothetical protein